jgi:hypothetical protein
MNTVLGHAILSLVFTMTPAVALAQATGAGPDRSSAALPAPEVIPYLSLDSRGTMPAGVAVTFPVSPRVSIETDVNYRRAEGGTNAISSSASVLFRLSPAGGATPYLAAGAGLAQYGAPIIVPGEGVTATQSKIALELNAGGGIAIPLNESVGLRTDARWFKSFGTQSADHWRIANGVSFDMRRR